MGYSSMLGTVRSQNGIKSSESDNWLEMVMFPGFRNNRRFERKPAVCLRNLRKSGSPRAGPRLRKRGEKKVAHWHGAGPQWGNGPEKRRNANR